MNIAAAIGELIHDAEKELAIHRERIDFLEKHIAMLRSKQGQSSSISASRGTVEALPALAGSTDDGSAMPDRIVRVLKQAARAMRANEITAVLQGQGVSTKGKKGLLPNILSALTRRDDLFVRVGRGVYALRN